MIIIFTALIEGLLLFLLPTIMEFIEEELNHSKPKLYKFFSWFAIFFIIFAISMTIWSAIYINKKNCQKVELVERVDIFSGYNSDKIDGDFFLLGGSVNEKDVVFYWVDNNGVKSKHSQYMNDSVFVEDGGEYLLLKRMTSEKGWRWFFNCSDETAEFHVPEGSIAKMYNYK